MSDPDSLLNFIRRLIAIRKATPALQRGDFMPLIEDPRFIFAYQRKLDEEIVVIVLNFSSRKLNFDLPEGDWVSLIDETHAEGILTLAPYQVSLLKATG